MIDFILFNKILFMIIMILHQQSIKLLKIFDNKKSQMKPSQPKIIILKSVKDFSKPNIKLNHSLELQQIKSMFTINNQTPYIHKTSSLKTQKLQSNRTMKKIQLQRCAEIVRSADYSHLQIGLLGNKSKSLNLKVAKIQRLANKKQKKKNKLSKQKQKNIKDKYLRLQPIKVNRQRNISQLMEKMEGMLKRQQQVSIKNVRKVITEGNYFNINNINLNNTRRQQHIIFSPQNRNQHQKPANKLKIGLRREIFSRNVVQQKKKMDKLLGDMKKNFCIQIPSGQRKSTDNFGPWKVQNDGFNQQNEQV